ncbi:MAG: MFS transporter, partial [Leptospiraceae bacterium]|nr:MFS transporter [Leptospiraceae bacterium]
FIFLSTCLTVLSIPHTALVADIAVDPDKRNKIFAIKMILGNMGLLLAISLPLLLSQEKQGLSDFYSLSFILAITIITSGLFSFFSSKGFDTNTHKNPSNQLISLLLKQVIANRAFLLFILAYFIAYIGVAINSSLALYYYQYKLGLRNQEIGLILIIFILSWLLASLLWLSLSNRFHKQKLAFLGIFLLGVLTSISYPFFPEKQLFYPLFMAVIGGFLVGSIFLFDSILADLEEADRLKTGTEKDGIYFSLAKFSMKASRSFAVALSGFLLSLIHFLPKQAQNPETNFQLGLLFGPFVGFFFILSSILFLKIPLKKNGVI